MCVFPRTFHTRTRGGGSYRRMSFKYVLFLCKVNINGPSWTLMTVQTQTISAGSVASKIICPAWHQGVENPLVAPRTCHRFTEVSFSTLWPPSVFLHLDVYSIHIHAGVWPATLDREVPDTGLGCHGVALYVLLSKAPHLYVHALDRGKTGYLVGQWLLVCLNGFQRPDVNRAVCSQGT